MSNGEEERNGGHGFLWFLIGVVLGVVGTIWGPRWAAPYLPSFLAGDSGVDGVVLEKVSEEDRILVKVSTPDGLVLVTFSQNREELDLLIGQGDSITLGLDGYQTLVENPPVSRVVGSPTPAVPTPALPPAVPEPEMEPQDDDAPDDSSQDSGMSAGETEDSRESDSESSGSTDGVTIEEDEEAESVSPAPEPAPENDTTVETEDDVR